VTAPKEMFLPGSRTEWTALVRPPEGYRLDSAIGTTYSLDFTALTAVLLASLDQQSNQESWKDRAHLIQAITRAGDRVRVLVNRGQIHTAVRASNKLFALFDQVVEEVRYKDGSFHPKVWVLKYIARRAVDAQAKPVGPRETIYRLICTSRNLTLASTWEAVVCLDGSIADTNDGTSNPVGRSVASFFETVRDGRPMPKGIELLLKELRRVTFSVEGSKAVQSCDFLWQSPGTRPLEALVTRGKTALMVSPFIGSAFLEALAGRFKTVIVVSCQQQLDACWDKIQRVIPLKNVWVVKATDSGDGSEDARALDLHAKILFCEYAGSAGAETTTEAWIGSANASARAWGLGTAAPMNCEAMVRCKPAIRPMHFLDQFAYRDGESVLNGWIEPYQPQEVAPLTAEEKADKYLDIVRHEMTALDLRVRFKRADKEVVLTLDSENPKGWAALFARHPGTRFEACPMGVSDSRQFSDLGGVADTGVQFDGLSMAEAGSLLVVRLTDIKTSFPKEFSIKLSLASMDPEFWEERRVAFLRENLDAKDFRAFLRCILFGEELQRDSVAIPEGKSEETDPGKRSAEAPAGLLKDFTVEDVLQSCTADSSRIEEVDRLVKMFADTQHVDAAFVAFWKNFRAALQATADSGHR